MIPESQDTFRFARQVAQNEMNTNQYNTGERSAVRLNSGQSVHQSDPGLRRPTPPPTAGRTPEARPPIHSHDFGVAAKHREAGLPSQRKTGRGVGQSPAIELQREALDSSPASDPHRADPLDTGRAESLSDEDIRQIIDFFKMLDRWEKETHER